MFYEVCSLVFLMPGRDAYGNHGRGSRYLRPSHGEERRHETVEVQLLDNSDLENKHATNNTSPNLGFLVGEGQEKKKFKRC
jgi:hypothetical protein